MKAICFLLNQFNFHDHLQKETELEKAFSDEFCCKIVSSWLPVRDKEMEVRFKEGIKVFLKDKKMTEAILASLSKSEDPFIRTICNTASGILYLACDIEEQYEKIYTFLFGPRSEPVGVVTEMFSNSETLNRAHEDPLRNFFGPFLNSVPDQTEDERERVETFLGVGLNIINGLQRHFD